MYAFSVLPVVIIIVAVGQLFIISSNRMWAATAALLMMMWWWLKFTTSECVQTRFLQAFLSLANRLNNNSKKLKNNANPKHITWLSCLFLVLLRCLPYFLCENRRKGVVVNKQFFFYVHMSPLANSLFAFFLLQLQQCTAKHRKNPSIKLKNGKSIFKGMLLSSGGIFTGKAILCRFYKKRL